MAIGLRQIVQWAAPISAIAVVSISISLCFPLFSLLLEDMGASGTVIGLNATSAAAAMVISAPVLPRILARVGLVRLMLGSILVMAAVMALIPVWYSVWWWALLRAFWGFCVTALFFCSEFWLVAIAPAAIRGRVIAAYAIILSGCYMLGPVLLNMIGIDNWATFAVPAAIILAGAIPVVLNRSQAPDAAAETPPHPAATVRFFRTDPMILWGTVLFGTIEYGAMGLITVWGLRSGMDQYAAVTLVFWLAFGAMAMQVPVGWAADRFDRRLLLALAAAVSLVMPLAMTLGLPPALIAAAVALWGGMGVAFYSLALTELGARYTGARLAEGTAAVVLGYGIGALVSPIAFGWAMDLIPPDGLLWAGALAACCYLALAVYRLSTKPVQTP